MEPLGRPDRAPAVSALLKRRYTSAATNACLAIALIGLWVSCSAQKRGAATSRDDTSGAPALSQATGLPPAQSATPTLAEAVSASRAEPAEVKADLRNTDLLVLQADDNGELRVVALSVGDPSRELVPLLTGLTSTPGPRLFWASRTLGRMMVCAVAAPSQQRSSGEIAVLKLWIADRSGVVSTCDFFEPDAEHEIESGAVSPTGSIALVICHKWVNCNLSVINVEDGAQGILLAKEERIFEKPVMDVSFPVWNPRSDVLAYFMLGKDEEDHKIRLWHHGHLASFSDALPPVVWSSDGERLAYVVSPGWPEVTVPHEQSLCCATVEGTNVKVLRRRRYTSFRPLFFPSDPYRIIYAEAHYDAEQRERYETGQEPMPETHYRCIDVRTGKITEAFPFDYAGVSSADLQPEQERLVFFGDGVNWPKSAIVEYRIGDREAAELGRVPHEITPIPSSIRWTPAGEGVVFRAFRGNHRFVCYAPRGGAPRTLTEGSAFTFW